MNRWALIFTSFSISSLVAGAAIAQQKAEKKLSAEAARGKYLIQIAGCNDCHTPGYVQSGGKVPENQWLKGDVLGWRGPWGTTYPANLRLKLQQLSEEQWVKFAKTAELRPPMPWFNLHAMTAQDLRAVYRFVKHLGPTGEAAPAYLPPGQEPQGPYVQFPAPPK